MKQQAKLILGIIATIASVIALLALFSDFRAPSLTLKESYEAPYGTEISVYDLVESVHDKSDVILTLNGDGTLVSDNKAIIFSTAGMHDVEVIASDVHGNAHSEFIRITLRDDTPPTIQASAITVCKGQKPDYKSAVSAMDAVDGDLSAAITVDDSKVDLETSGSYQVIYRVADRSGNEAICKSQVIVTRSIAESMTMSTSSMSLSGNDYAQLKVYVMPTDWEGTVEWSSSNEKVATVSDGLVYWQGKGRCVITAKADDCEAECTVICTGVDPTSVTLNKRKVTLDEGESVTLRYSTLPSNWSGDVKWSSSNPAVASVKNGVVTWKGNGTCYVTASAGNNVYGSCEVVCTGGFTIDDFLDDILGGGDDDKDKDDKDKDDKDKKPGTKPSDTKPDDTKKKDTTKKQN